MLNGKAMIIRLIAGLIKKTLYKMSQYIPEQYRTLRRVLMSKKIYPIMQQKQI